MRYLVVLSAIAILGSCAKNGKVSKRKQDFYLSMQKTACFGACPTYILTIVDDGSMVLNSKQYMKPTGVNSGQLDSTEFSNLMVQANALSWPTYDSAYLTGYSDLPQTFIWFSNVKGDTTVLQYETYKAPKELQALGKRLEEIAHRSEWKRN